MEVHGNGANMDNFETHDERRVMPWSCFSIEPGVYLPDVRRARRDQHVHRRERSAGDGRDSAGDGAALMPFQALAAAATLFTVAPHGNRIELQLDHGSAELLWVSPGTFRFRRVLEGPLPKIEWSRSRPGAGRNRGHAAAVQLRTHAIEVTHPEARRAAEVRGWTACR